MRLSRSVVNVLALGVMVAVATACGPSAVSPTSAVNPTVPIATGQATTPTEPAAGQPVEGGTLVASFNGVAVADTLNQHTSDYTPSRMVAHHVLDTLVAVDPEDGSIQPWLASSWEISPDCKVYTFKLREDVRFHDGTPFNAEAVKYNFDYTVRPDVKHGFAWMAIGAEEYDRSEVVDEFTVKVYFKSPQPWFLANLSDGGMGIDSPTAMEDAGDDYGISVLVGTGPFKFVEWVRDNHVTLARNEEYNWAAPLFGHQGPPYLDQLVYRDVADVSTQAAALEAGELHLLTLVESQAAQFGGNEDVQILPVPKAGTTRMVVMNLTRPPTDDIRVRQAINYALDKEAMIQLPAWSGYANPGVAPLPANMVPGGDLSSVEPYAYPYDPEEAKQLLDEAGWTVGADGIREKDGEQLVLDIVVPDIYTSYFEPMDPMLREVGIKLNFQIGDFNFWWSKSSEGDFDLTVASDSGYNGPAMVSEFFYSKSGNNFSRYQSDEVDQYIENALSSVTQEEVWENIMPAMGQIMKDAVGVMLWEQTYVYGARANVHDVFFNEVGYPYMYDAWIEE